MKTKINYWITTVIFDEEFSIENIKIFFSFTLFLIMEKLSQTKTSPYRDNPVLLISNMYDITCKINSNIWFTTRLESAFCFITCLCRNSLIASWSSLAIKNFQQIVPYLCFSYKRFFDRLWISLLHSSNGS